MPVQADDSIPQITSPDDWEQYLTTPGETDGSRSDTGLPVPRSTTIDTSKKIGTPVTSFAVSTLGAAQWSLTFDTPQGVGGLTPKVGLSYSSLSSNGNAGWGINITGISCITRGMKTLYHDDAPRGMKFDPNDALFLDGRRLLLSSGTEGMTNAIYSPEGDPYTTVKVTSSNSQNGPLTFEVTSSDGMKTYYGTDANARLQFTYGGIQRVHAWYVSRQEDANGNYVTYSYMHDQLVVYPETVTYGMNTQVNTGACHYISFSYTNVLASAKRSFVLGGHRGYVTKCLANVRTMTGTSVYREYVLNYDHNSDGTRKKFERLTSVTCKNGAGEEMNPVTLTWDTMQGSSQQTETTPYNWTCAHPGYTVKDSIFLAADMDGNGLADIIRISKEKNGDVLYDFAYIYRALLGNNGQVTYAQPQIFSIGSDFNRGFLTHTFLSNFIADFDGDGLSDFVLPYYNTNHGPDNATFYVLLGKDVKYGTNSYSYSYTEYLQAESHYIKFLTGDVNKDGRDDILFIEDEKKDGYNYLHVLLSTGTSFSHIETPLSDLGVRMTSFLGDYNGDGLTDLIEFDHYGYKLYFHTGNNSLPYVESASTIVSYDIQSQWRMEQGDFNGDGLVDFVYVGASSPDYYFALNNGDGTFDTSLACDDYTIFDQTTEYDDARLTLTPLDLDRDGLTDLVVSKAKYNHHGGLLPYDSFSRTMVGWLLSDGSTLTEVRQVDSYGHEDEACPHNVMLADFDGDGWPELANNGADWYTNTTATQDGCHVRVYHDTGFTAASGRLTSVSDGLGTGRSVAYATTANPAVYTHAYGQAADSTVINVHAPLPVVASFAEDRGAAGIHTTTCTYSGLLAHRTGAGLLGFTETSQTDQTAGVTTSHGVAQWHDALPVPTCTWDSTRVGTWTAHTEKNMAIYRFQGKNYAVFPLSIQTTDLDGYHTATTCAYDSIKGVPVEELTIYGSDDMYRRTTYTGYQQKGGRWLPAGVTLTARHVDDTQAFADSTAYTYDTKGNVLTGKRHAGTDLELTTAYTYDSHGNMLTETATGYGVPAVTRQAQYDGTGRFVTRRTQTPAATVTEYTRDTWGHILTETDATETGNPLTTAYTLDGWGDPLAVTSPEGLTTTCTYSWYSSPSERYKVTETDATGASSTTSYDAAGRRRTRESTGPCGLWIREVTNYNSRGDVSEEVTLESNYVDVDHYSFDARGRVTQHSKAGTVVETYAYDGRTATVTRGGHSTSKTTDAWGNTILTVDALGNEVEYTYRSCGRPSSVTSCGSTVTMDYDEAGNQVELADPDAGTMTYGYAADGTLLWQEDARGVLTEYEYDTRGRLSSETCGDMVTTYTYGTSGHGTHRLASVSTGTFTESYAYDQYGRRTGRTRSYGGGTSLSHTYSYNAKGQTASITYPSGLVQSFRYDADGHCDSVLVGNDLVWRAESYDGRHAVSRFGSLRVKTSRDHEGRLTARLLTNAAATDTLAALSFAYDNVTGNLVSRTGVAGAGVTETFSYDALDRLTGAAPQGGTAETFTYEDNGNIAAKAHIGSYTYQTARPHAVMSVSNTDNRIGKTQQDITYGPLGKAVSIADGSARLTLSYGPDRQRWRSRSARKWRTDTLTVETLHDGGYERVTTEDGTVREFHRLGRGLVCVVTDGGSPLVLCALTDNVGSYVQMADSLGQTRFRAGYDVWGRQTVTSNAVDFQRGYGGHEMLPRFALVNMDGRLYDPNLGRFLSPDNYVQAPDDSQSFNRYSYCLNNPLKYTDPTGEFFTWFLGKGGFSFGINLSPIGIPLGFGVNIGCADGNSIGAYVELGIRVGGTGFGSGVTVSQSFDFNCKHGKWTTTTSESVYGSLGMFNAGGGFSQTYDFNNKEWQCGWGGCAGVGFGNDECGIGLNASYGSGGWSLGLGGYYDWHAWDDNPDYNPDEWNRESIKKNNNCYTYALDNIECNSPGGLNPGNTTERIPIPSEKLNLNDVLELALTNNQIKKPTLLNRLGFGKRGYYSAYLVVDEGVDYHWYRQDKGGLWSHKPGSTRVINYDGSNRIIYNPMRANHDYKNANYNNGGILLWIKRY